MNGDRTESLRAKRFNSIVERRDSVAADSMEYMGLRTLAEISRPLDQPLADTDRRAVISSARETLADRSVRYVETTSVEGIDGSGQRVRDREPLIFDISGALILPWHAVLLEDRLYVGDFQGIHTNWRRFGLPFISPERAGFKDYDEDTQQCVVELPNDICVLDADKPYFLFQCYQARGNFGHFIHDTLVQVGAYRHVEKMLGEAPIPIIMNEFRYPIQKFLFETLVQKFSRCIKTDLKALRVPRLYSTDSHLVSGRDEVSRAAFQYVRQRLQDVAAQFGNRGADYPRKIYVSRRDADKVDGRCFANTEAVEAAIFKAGFRPVVVGELTPEEILGVFSGAESIVGVHGAGMLNALFSQNEPRIIELWGHPASWRSVAMIDWACDIEHRVVRCDGPLTPGAGPVARIEEICEAIA